MQQLAWVGFWLQMVQVVEIYLWFITGILFDLL
jgi:hypothetical protein